MHRLKVSRSIFYNPVNEKFSHFLFHAILIGYTLKVFYSNMMSLDFQLEIKTLVYTEIRDSVKIYI